MLKYTQINRKFVTFLTKAYMTVAFIPNQRVVIVLPSHLLGVNRLGGQAWVFNK